MEHHGQDEGHQLAGRTVIDAVATAIIAEIFADVPEVNRPKATADMPEEQAARFRAAARAAITASLSAGEPDGMETTAENRSFLAKIADQGVFRSYDGKIVLALLRDFDRLLAREAKAREEIAALANQWARNWEAAAAAGLPSGEATTADFLDQFAAAVRGTS